ncbi:MAG TPA: stage II sporulation protein M [Gemmatimonadales bacterium]
MPALRGPSEDYRQHLEVETPEHVVLDLEIAGIGSRTLAALLDLLILIGAAAAVMTTLAVLGGYGLRLGRLAAAILLLVGYAVATGYYIVFEGVRGGQTPGKRIVGIRVVMDTGHAVTLGAAAVRNLLRAADFLPPPYLLGALFVAFHPRGKRLGDIVAGTVVARDRPHEPPPGRRRVESPEAPSIPELADAEFRLLTQFVERQGDLAPDARARLASSIVRRIGGASSPTGVSDQAHLLELHARELGRREGALARRGAAGSGTRFAAQKRDRWDAFERLADRAARSGLDRFGSDELPDFAARYREVAADLARSRTYRADEATQARLERLVAAGHNALYREERGAWQRLWVTLTRECPAAIVAARRYVLVAFLAFALPAAAGFTLMRERPALAAELLPDVMLQRAESGSERRKTGRGYVEVDAQDRPLVASGIITNNVRIAITCFAGGIFLGVGSLVLLAFNGLTIGASAGHFANMGLLGYLLEFIVGHGVLELFAIWVAGAAGFLLGRTVVAPGTLARADALVVSGRQAVRMLGGAALLLLVAGMIEGFVSASRGGLPVRLSASVASLAFLAFYLSSGIAARSSR